MNPNEKRTCANCSKAIFDPVWGEYKCSVLNCRVLPGHVVCLQYVIGEPQISKQHPDYDEE